MSLSFCAIDFETANTFRGSPCAVGLVKVVDGQVVDTRRWLMRPPEGYDEFDAFNIMLHGITPEMVRGEPRFAERLPEILAFADGLPFVAHNAAFDMGVIRDACDASDSPGPTASYACTLVFSRADVEPPVLLAALGSRGGGRRVRPPPRSGGRCASCGGDHARDRAASRCGDPRGNRQGDAALASDR